MVASVMAFRKHNQYGTLWQNGSIGVSKWHLNNIAHVILSTMIFYFLLLIVLQFIIWNHRELIVVDWLPC